MSKNIDSLFSQRLRDLRQQNNLTQAVLADKVNLSQQTIDHYEKERVKPKIETVQKLAKYFHVNTEFLLGESPFINYNQEKTSILIAIAKELSGGIKEHDFDHKRKRRLFQEAFENSCYSDIYDENTKIFLQNIHYRQILFETKPLTIEEYYAMAQVTINEVTHVDFARNFVQVKIKNKVIDLRIFFDNIEKVIIDDSQNKIFFKAQQPDDSLPIQENDQEKAVWYYNHDIIEIAKEISSNPNLQKLFEFARKTDEDDVKWLIDTFKHFREK